MCLRWGTTLQIVLKKAGVDKDAIRSLKPNDSALRERGRPIFFSKQNSWQSLLLPDEIRWVTAGCSVTKRGKTSVWWHLGGWWGSAGTRGWKAALGAATGKSRRLHTWAGRPERRENEGRARAKVRYDEQWLCLRSSAGPARHGKGTDPHFFVPAPASHPSPSSRVVRGRGEGCAKEQHVCGFGWFVCFSLSEGLSYCYLLSGGAAWSPQWGKPRGVTTKEGGCRARGNLSKNKSHWNTPGKQPSVTHTGVPL